MYMSANARAALVGVRPAARGHQSAPTRCKGADLIGRKPFRVPALTHLYCVRPHRFYTGARAWPRLRPSARSGSSVCRPVNHSRVARSHRGACLSVARNRRSLVDAARLRAIKRQSARGPCSRHPRLTPGLVDVRLRRTRLSPTSPQHQLLQRLPRSAAYISTVAAPLPGWVWPECWFRNNAPDLSH